MRHKNFDRKSWHNSLKHKIFRYQKLVTHWRFSITKFFGAVRQTFFDGKSWYPPPLLCIKVFDTPNFLNYGSDAHEIFRHCEIKNFGRKNVIAPFSCIKLFETRIFLKNSRIPLRNFSSLWDIKFSTENRDTPSPLPPPPLIHNFFSIPDFFWYTDQKGSPTKFFSTETKKISTQNCEINLWSIKSFDPRKPEISDTLKVSPTKFFGTVRQTFFDGKSWYSLRPSPLLSISFFDTRTFLKQRRVPLRSIFGTVRQQYFL